MRLFPTPIVALAVALAAVGPGALGLRTADAQPPATPPAASASAATTTIVIVRHAEKGVDAANPQDPPLTDAGKARAAALAESLKDAEVAAVYATQYRRTHDTGEPLARRFKVEVTARPVTAANAAKYADEVAREVLEKHAGKTVVVVGHSNTVADLIEALGARAPEPLTDADYDRLFIVVRPASGPARLIVARYGAPDAR